MRRLISVSLLLLLLSALPVLADDKDEVPIVEEPGGCGFCGLPKCGCTAPPPGYVLSFNCACGTVSCSRDCVYERI